MRKYLSTLLGAAWMVLVFNANTGDCIGKHVDNPRFINDYEANFVRHINQLPYLNCTTTVLNNGQGGLIEVLCRW